MTTPQSILSNIEYNTRQTLELLEGNEHTGDITEILAQMELQQDDLMCSQIRLENLMNLIVKFLSKQDVTQCCVNSNTTQCCVKSKETI
jgi:hypothetical protein